jgi:hypothetical protein
LSTDARGNIHLAEERQQLTQKDIDETNRYLKANDHNEEMLYSGVIRKEEHKQAFPGGQ